MIVRVTLRPLRRPSGGLIGILASYSYSTPQAGSKKFLSFPVSNLILTPEARSRPNLASPVANFRIGLFWAHMTHIEIYSIKIL